MNVVVESMFVVVCVSSLLMGRCDLIRFNGLSVCFFFFKQKTAYEMRISDWSSDVCSSDLATGSRNRKLSSPGSDLEGILSLRYLEDSERIKEAAKNEIGRASCRERVCQYV